MRFPFSHFFQIDLPNITIVQGYCNQKFHAHSSSTVCTVFASIKTVRNRLPPWLRWLRWPHPCTGATGADGLTLGGSVIEKYCTQTIELWVMFSFSSWCCWFLSSCSVPVLPNLSEVIWILLRPHVSGVQITSTASVHLGWTRWKGVNVVDHWPLDAKNNLLRFLSNIQWLMARPEAKWDQWNLMNSFWFWLNTMTSTTFQSSTICVASLDSWWASLLSVGSGDGLDAFRLFFRLSSDMLDLPHKHC